MDSQEYYIGQVFTENYPSDAVEWCALNKSEIHEIEPKNKVRRFEITAQPEITTNQKKAGVRSVRDLYIKNIEWRVSRYRAQLDIEIPTTDDATTYAYILRYMQYLRDYPKSSETWYEQNPLTFEEWQDAH